jgi:hypothetical protein
MSRRSCRRVAMFSCVLRSNGRREGSHFHEHFLCDGMFCCITHAPRGVVSYVLEAINVLATVPSTVSSTVCRSLALPTTARQLQSTAVQFV